MRKLVKVAKESVVNDTDLLLVVVVQVFEEINKEISAGKKVKRRKMVKDHFHLS